ncbi:MAG: hypothetical protein ABI337_01625 [Nitrososphaera sp.]|jgi:hypothetical protein
MGFPALDISLTKLPIALVLKPGNALEVRKIKLISSKFFLMRPWGIFEIDPTKWVKYDKNHVYFYDVRNAKPFPLSYLKELEDFAKKNQLHKIRRKDVRHASILRKRLAAGEDRETALRNIQMSEDRVKAEIEATIEQVNESIQKELVQQTPEGEQVQLQVDIEEYISVIIDQLLKKKLIEKHEAFALKTRMAKGEVTVDEFIEKIAELKLVEIHTPIGMELEKVIEDFHTYEPAIVDAFIDRAEKIGEKIKKMGTPVVRNFMPVMYIFLIMIAAIVLGAAFSNMDFSNFKLPKLFGNFILWWLHG